MQIELRKLDEVKPYENNPRVNDDAVEAVAKSIKEFGFRQPLVVDADGIIICGHTRWKSAKLLGLEKVPVHVARDLTPEQIKAYRIADNKTNELSEWNYELLPLELSELQEMNFDLSLLGFDSSELEELLNGDAIKEGLTDPDEVPETPEEPVSKRGEIYQLGSHRLMCGDSTKIDDVKTLMDGKLADLLLEDLPYNVNYEGENGMTIQNDNMPDEAFRNFLIEAFKCSYEIMKPGASFYIFHADTEGYNFRHACIAAGMKIRQCLVWKKDSLVLGRQPYHWLHEPILFGWKDGAAHSWYSDRKQTTVLEFARPKKSELHPCLTPDSLIMTIKGYLPIGEIKKGDLVLSHDGAFHPVSLVTRHSYHENIIRIGVAGTNIGTKATHNHPFLTTRKNKDGIYRIEFIPAAELKVGDYLLTPQLKHGGRSDIQKLDAFCYGLWLAQGSLQKAGHGENIYPSFALDVRKTHLREKLKAWAGNAHMGIYPNQGNGITIMVFDAEKGRRCLELCGKGASKKILHPEVFEWNRELRQSFYEGYIAGDGCRIRKHLHAKSVSQSLATQMKFIAESLGYKTAMYFRPAPGGRVGNHVFKKTLPFYSSDYHPKGECSKQINGGTTFLYNGVECWPKKVKRIEFEPHNGEVINLNVDEMHTFQTAVGMSHNTMKPVEMLVYLMKNSSRKGDIVADLFGGSGSTLIAAEQTGRKAYLMELDEKYCDVIRKRWAEFVHGEGGDWAGLSPKVESIQVAS